MQYRRRFKPPRRKRRRVPPRTNLRRHIVHQLRRLTIPSRTQQPHYDDQNTNPSIDTWCIHQRLRLPPPPRDVAGPKNARADETPRSAISVISPTADVAPAYQGVRAATPLDLLPYRRDPIVLRSGEYSPRLPHTRFLSMLIFQQLNARGYYSAWLCPTKYPSR